jgi:hypothetical protein
MFKKHEFGNRIKSQLKIFYYICITIYINGYLKFKFDLWNFLTRQEKWHWGAD